MNPRRTSMSKHLTFWKKVGIVCGGVLALIAVASAIWQGASFAAAWAWAKTNHQNVAAFQAVNRRLDAGEARDSVLIGKVEAIGRALNYPLYSRGRISNLEQAADGDSVP